MYDNELDSKEYKGYTIRIYQDLDWDCHNPREWDNLGHMICAHNKYELGDEQIRAQDYESWDHIEKELLINDPEVILWRPLYLYDHGGITMSSAPFSCGWDSGQVGFIYLDAEGFSHFDSIEDAAKALIQEVDIYSSYLEGDIVYYIVENEDGGIIDSCGGYVGESLEYVYEEGKSVIDWEIKARDKEKREVQVWAERDVVTI